jgi:hypothetical protein
MTSSSLKRNSLPFHVLLVAAFPPLALLASNLSQVSPNVVIRPLLISIALGLVLLFLAWLLMRNLQRAALTASLLVILFFSYGHLYPLLKGINLEGLYLFRHRTLLIIWLLLAVGGAWFFGRKNLPLQSITSGLNLVALALVVMPLIQILVPTVRNAILEARMPGAEPVTQAVPSQDSPDIYYIVLDAHGRSDILKNHTGYDDSNFIQSLEGLGFYVAKCSQANYSLTLLSLTSSLNYTYLEDLMGENGGVDLQYYISRSAIRQFLEQNGYKTVAFATGFQMTQLTDADYYFEPGTAKDNEFEAQLLKTTAWVALVDAGLAPEMDSSAENYRDRTLLVLDTLRELPDLEGPKFVFAHIVSPHPPYIFDARGNFHDVGLGEHDEKNLTPQEMAPLYRGQVEFIDNQVLDVVRTILEKSRIPPVIILQGDHGPLVIDKSIRMPILNAYYLPGGGEMLRPSISPVNSFRVVLDAFFGQSLPLLEDVSRFSLDYRNPFDYRDVPNTCVE